jgi:hypothetical protein
MLADRDTPELYREQAARLTAMAAQAGTPERRLELLDMASVFRKLADHASKNRKRYLAIAAKSA